ncbi:hypothetical protein P3G55_07215 [Leptospira sp. 96542]|nr:hypothetical protein [Leptospira sp. 96542]
MAASEIQIQLIQESVAILVKKLQLTTEEAIGVISKAIKQELNSRKVTLELLEISALSERTSFVRSVVKHVQDQIQRNPNWKVNFSDRYIENFYQSLHRIVSAKEEE